MSSTIKCPNCSHEFEATDAFRDEVQKDLNAKAKEWQTKREEEYKKKEEDYKKKEEAFHNQMSDALNKQKQSLEEGIRKTLSQDFENQLRLLGETNKANEEKLKQARQKELDFLRKEQELKNKEAEFEINLQKKLQEERTGLTEQIRKQEAEKIALKENEYQMKLKELEKQVEDQKKLAQEALRKAEQGSMQLQGEAQELVLEELLRTTFPFDLIEEVGKGVRGADVMQVVRNQVGQICGKIIYESKRTKAFGGDWIEKLKNDMRAQQADIAVIVTDTMPRDMERFGLKDGVWICNFTEVRSMAFLLRDSLVKIQNAVASNENKGDKMTMLYSYLTSNEFRQQIEAIVEGFTELQMGIAREKNQMQKIWKEREKQLEKVLLNTTNFYGSIKGIAGSAVADIKLLDLGE